MFDQRGQFVNNAQVNIGGSANQSPTKFLFAGAIHAQRDQQYHWKPFACVSASLEEAIGKAVIAGKVAFSFDDGYVNHSADMMQIEWSLIKQVIV